ncbi:Dehydrodolichyl diphosphate synthase [Thalictrum thalictroides]|uniref:Dehydrodolichyl diphosphate synthase n=1 Tax=Thalictrum thalictroides TaxID=46969 RepID=A0A7J6XEB2_THATH|nr:Dehydrodolichyl diphosphate synthase [Thalictrum thalictroides]
MDGNRRYVRNSNMNEGEGHRSGFLALMSMLQYCYELGVKVYFIGNLQLLREPVRLAAEKVMNTTCNNNKVVLLICLAYTSTDEIVHSVQEACNERRVENEYLISKNVDNDSGVVVGKKKNDMDYGVCYSVSRRQEAHVYGSGP